MLQADWGVPVLYGIGAMCMGLMVLMVWGYVRKFGVDPSMAKTSKKKVLLFITCVYIFKCNRREKGSILFTV